MKSTKLDVAVAVAFAATAVVAIEGLWPGSGHERRARAEADRMSRELNLSAEQAAEVESILLDPAALADPEAADEQIAALLTDEQRERLRRLRAEQRARRPRASAEPP
jgi:Spy/CpxP family protein refolding chaperone